MTTPWHVVRTVNFLLSLPPIKEYQLFYVRGAGGKRIQFDRVGERFPLTRLVWRKDRFRVRLKHMFVVYYWLDVDGDDRIEDSYGRVFLRGSDLREEGKS